MEVTNGVARKFITEKEIAFINKINRELIQDFVGQEIIYYAISEEHTVSHDLYRESIDKVWFSPVKINARVEYDNTVVEASNLTLDSKHELTVWFHNEELNDRNVSPKDGDFVEFSQIVFEITSVTTPELVFGQPNNRIMTRCVCKPSREGQMQVHSDSSRFVDNTHPVEPEEC